MTPIEDVILFQIDLTSKLSKQWAQADFDRLGLGITVEQWVVLKIISEHSGISQKELADKSFRDPASITRTLDLLEKKQLLRREPIEGNRRKYKLLLTETGIGFIRKHTPFVQSQRNQSTAGISTKELEQLSATLLKIRQNMK
ncbi:MAG: MarR family winged helix-turn-helix transcriptional regulator [Fluviicola sp.]